jgi:hypothetical protein
MLALAPKAPFIGYGGQFEGYENQWKTANTTNWPYLEVNPDVTDGMGATLPLPQRAPPPLAQTGLIQAKMGASDDIKSTTGQYDSSLGATSNERSGKAILARERQGDVGTYHYGDNLNKAIRYATRQLIDLIPKIYDTERIARIVGVDGKVSMVKLNPDQPEAVKKIVDQQGIVIENVGNNCSAYNSFYDVGNHFLGTANPATAVIDIDGINNVSVGDMFERTTQYASALLPRIKLNNLNGIALGQNVSNIVVIMVALMSSKINTVIVL